MTPEEPRGLPCRKLQRVYTAYPEEQVLAAFDLLAYEKKGGAGPPLPETVQQSGRCVPAGTVVKGQGHEAAGGNFRRPCRRAGLLPARQEAEKEQKGAERPALSPQFADLPASQIGLVCAEGLGFTLGIRGRTAMGGNL